MPIWVITKVSFRRDWNRWVDYVEWRSVDEANREVGPLQYVSGDQVANAIVAGDPVYCSFKVDGHHVLGPALVRRVVGLNETVDDAPDAPLGRRLEDLPSLTG